MVDFRTDLREVILDFPELRYCEIYRITNNANGKMYIGKAVSHILNHKRYRPHGMRGRFNQHVSESKSKKKFQCHYLNNAIRKYGRDKFSVELLRICSIEESDSIEREEIIKHNSLYPLGYNLNTRSSGSLSHTIESRRRVSNGMRKFSKQNKFERFSSISLDSTDDPLRYIRPLFRNKNQYGWYVYIKKVKADFGGVHISLEESRNEAIMFVEMLENKTAKHLVAGSPLEPLLPLSSGNS